MATQEIPSGNGIKDISIPRINTYIKIAEKNGSRLLPGRSILSIAISFRFSPSLCLKFRTSFSGDNGEDMRLAMTTNKQTNTRANKEQRAKEANRERERGQREREGE